MQCYLYVSFFFVLSWITAPDYYITIVYIGKNRCKIGNNLKNAICNGTKIVVNLYFEKLYIVVVTDICAFVHAWVIALEYQFLYDNMDKISILFN